MNYTSNRNLDFSASIAATERLSRYREPLPEHVARLQESNEGSAMAARFRSGGDATASANQMANAMTVDVEDYFQVSAFENYIERESWSKFECRVLANTDRILDTFSAKGAKATFFTLGWVGKRYPELLKRIIAEGHELASHGWDHVRVVNFNKEQFREDVIRAKGVLEDLSGAAVKGYRAPCYSISMDNLWAHDVLLETGHTYSSSIAPIEYRHYGLPDEPRFPHHRKGKVVVDSNTPDAILEVPVTTIRVGKKNYPVGGGGWFRLYPYRISKLALEHVNHSEREPCVFYYHPWEIDVDQPRLQNLDLKTRLRHYQNLGQMERKVDRLLGDFKWRRMDQVYNV